MNGLVNYKLVYIIISLNKNYFFFYKDANPNDTFWQFNSILDDWKELCSLQIPRSELGNNTFDIFFE